MTRQLPPAAWADARDAAWADARSADARDAAWDDAETGEAVYESATQLIERMIAVGELK